MQKVLQIRIDSRLKAAADRLFASLGLDTSTAVRIFFNAALEEGGIPFEVKHKTPNAALRQAMEDVRNGVGLSKPYKTAKEAIAAMLEDDECEGEDA